MKSLNHKLNQWKFKELAAWMDGGSTTLYFTNENNQEQTIDIQQHVVTEYYEEHSKIPGRVYLNDELIEKRSISESTILKYLKESVVIKLNGLEKDILTHQINCMIGYIIKNVCICCCCFSTRD